MDKAEYLDYAVELHDKLLAPLKAARRLELDRRAAERQAKEYLAARDDGAWADRLTTSPASRRAEHKAAMDDAVRRAMKMRDSLSPGSSAYFKAQEEVNRLSALARAA
jgi:hypothetical protein